MPSHGQNLYDQIISQLSREADREARRHGIPPGSKNWWIGSFSGIRAGSTALTWSGKTTRSDNWFPCDERGIAMMSDEVPMPNLTVRNIPTKLYRSLQRTAKRSGRSLNAEILALLADEDAWKRRRWHLAEAIPQLITTRKELAKKYPNLHESVASIREDRDSR